MDYEQHLQNVKRIAPKVLPQIQERSARRLAALDDWTKDFNGLMLGFRIIRSGQTRPYGDSVDEYQIFAYQLNSLTTREPMERWLDREQVLALTRMLFGSFTEEPKFLERRLEFVRPDVSPLGEDKPAPPKGKATCWRVRLRTPWND